jgi:predicted nucleic acid-binding protein
VIVCLDTNIVIYYVEQNPVWAPKVDARLKALLAAGDTLAVCDLARAECMIGPLKSGDAVVLADYQRFFANPAVKMLPLMVVVCERAAQVRVATAMKLELPDCLHLDAAIANGCGLFLTNDAQLSRCTDITVEILT